MGGHPIRPVRLRHYDILDPQGHHPGHEAGGVGADPWWDGIPPEQMIELHHRVCAEIYAERVGIRLEIDEIIEVDDEAEWSTHVEPIDDAWLHRDLFDEAWDRGQPYFSIFWVRKIVGGIGAHSAVPHYYPIYEGGGWGDGFGIIIEGGSHAVGKTPMEYWGMVLGHELGHLLGLSHTWDGVDFVGEILAPFPFDQYEADLVQGESLNLMNYWDKLTPTPDQMVLTPSQVKRMRLTCTSRRSPWQEYWRLRVPRGRFPELTDSELNASGFGNLSIYPDLVPAFNAAWCG